MNKTIYGSKLAHYAKREPKSFLQLDSFFDGWGADKDGDALSALGTVELMRGACARVLIPASTDKKMAVRQLKKIAKWLDENPDFISKYAESLPEKGEMMPF